MDRVAAAVPAQPAGPGRLPRRRPPRPAGRRTCGRRSIDHLRAQGEDPRGWRITLVANLRVAGYVFDPASFFLCRDARRRPAGRRGRGPQHARRAPPVHAPPARRGLGDLRRRDGQGVLRLAVHRDARRLRGPRPRRAGAAADHDQPAPARGPRAARQPRPRPTAADRPEPAAAAAPPPVPAPADDGPHPLARPAAVAARRPVPTPSTRSPDEQPHPPRRPRRGARTAGPPRLARRAGGRRADPHRPAARRPARRLRPDVRRRRAPTDRRRSGSTTARR